MGCCEHVCGHNVFRNRESGVMVGYQLPHAVSIVVVSTELEMKCAVLYFPITRIFFRLFFFTVTKYQLSRNM